MSEILYGDADVTVTLTPEQQSMAVQACAIFMAGYNWADYSDNADDIDSLVASTINSLINPQVIRGYKSMIDCWARLAVTNFTQVYNGLATQPFGGYVNRSGTPAQFDYFEWQDVILQAGNYQLTVLWVRATNSANVRVQIEDGASGIVIIGTINMHGLFLVNQSTTFTFTVPNDADWSLYAIAHSLPTGSTGYAMNLTSIHVERL